jgi:replicative DNA helicase
MYDEEFARKVIPFIKEDYFTDRNDQVVIEEIVKFFDKYSKLITKEILTIEVLDRKDLSQTEAKQLPEFVDTIAENVQDVRWLITETERFFQKRAVYLAILDSIAIIEGKDTKKSEDAIPSLLQDALSVTFDMQVGHDYLEDTEDRYDFYHLKETGIPFNLEIFDKITGGVGLRPKTLTCVSAKTGGGKSIFLCHTSANALMQGKNVLYITMEMSEYRIAERIDANLFDTPLLQLKNLDKKNFTNRIEKIKAKTHGRLVVKEYPTGAAHAGHFRALIEELKAKKDFVPDLICVDYMNICASQRVRNHNANSYTIVKSIAEELRAIAVEYNVPVLTATQLNRGGMASTDVEMTDTSESIGAVAALDLYFAIIRTEELDELGQVLIKQLKNRYGDPNNYKRFVIGLDSAKMKFHDVEASAQENVSGATEAEEYEEEPVINRPSLKKKLNTEQFRF